MANIRRDAAHELTTGLTRRFETIVIADLNVSGRAKNHSLAGAVLDCGFHEIRRRLAYKAAMCGGRIAIADRFYPSMQICSCRGSITGPKGREGPGVKQGCCSACGADHTGDANAAIVLRKLGLANTELTRGDMAPLSTCAGMPTSTLNREPNLSVRVRTFNESRAA